MPRSLLILLAMAYMLGGCASNPVRVPEAAAVPGAWSSAVSTAATSGAQASTAWWKELGDSELDDIIATALETNADVSVAATRVRQARALTGEARAARQPRLDMGDSAARERVPKSFVRDPDGVRSTVPATRQSRFSSQVEARYEIDLLGRLALGEKAAAADLDASEADLRAVKQWLVQEVILIYADLRLAEDRATVASDAEVALERLLAAEQERLKAGLIGRERLRDAERQMADKRDEMIAIGHERHAARARLAGLAGKAPVEVEVRSHEHYFGQLVISGAVTADLPAVVIEQRADVAAAWHRVLAANHQAERTRLERYPSLTLTGNLGFVSASIRRWLTGDALAWVAQVVLSEPLLDGGRARARGDQAIAVMDEQFALHRKVVLQALVEVETTLSAAQAGKSRVDLAETELARRLADRDAADRALAAGINSRPSLLQAELALLAATDTVSLRRHELLGAWVNAQKALGR